MMEHREPDPLFLIISAWSLQAERNDAWPAQSRTGHSDVERWQAGAVADARLWLHLAAISA